MEIPWRRLAGIAALLPGALLGAHVTGLLYFLNPSLPLSPIRVIQGLLIYGGAFALVGGVLQSPWVLLRPRLVLRALPWLVSAVLTTIALLLALHASHYAYLLPPGVNTRLIKASIVLGLAGLIAFYTALLHSLAGRRYGTRSRWCLWILALGSLYVMVERREAYHPKLQETLASSVEEPGASLLVVVGLEGASLDVVLPLSEQGSLPFFAESLRVGSFARLRTQPLRREPLLTTLVTGKWPYKHGLVGSFVYNAPSFGSATELHLLPLAVRNAPWILGARAARRSTSEDRRALAAWEITSRLGLATGITGWPEVTTGAKGLVFSTKDTYPGDEYITSPLGSDRTMATPTQATLDLEALEEFPARFREVVRSPLSRDQALSSGFATLAGDTPAAEVLFLNLPGLATVSERFIGAYSRSPFEGTGDAELATAAGALTAYYRWLDATLAALWSSTSQPATLVIVSAHGYRASSWWQHRGREEAMLGGVVDATTDGLLIARGRGLRSSAYVADAAIEDVLPTLLYAAGLPIARDLDGHVLTGLFEPVELTSRPLSFLPSYETLVGERPTRAPGVVSNLD